MNALATYLKNVRTEMSHVVWPSRRQSLIHVALIVLISIATALFIAGLDYVFTQGVGYLLR
jgi:preprotein translocase subunit SecE